jgi:hypothetical protein
LFQGHHMALSLRQTFAMPFGLRLGYLVLLSLDGLSLTG